MVTMGHHTLPVPAPPPPPPRTSASSRRRPRESSDRGSGGNSNGGGGCSMATTLLLVAMRIAPLLHTTYSFQIISPTVVVPPPRHYHHHAHHRHSRRRTRTRLPPWGSSSTSSSSLFISTSSSTTSEVTPPTLPPSPAAAASAQRRIWAQQRRRERQQQHQQSQQSSPQQQQQQRRARPPWSTESNSNGRNQTVASSRTMPTTTTATATTKQRPAQSQQQQQQQQPRPRPRITKKTQPLPVTGYDASAIEEYYDVRPLQVGWRLNSLGFPLLGWYIRLLYDKTIGQEDDPVIQKQRGIELRELLVQSKSVALIKSGQALSLRPDLIRNTAWADELEKLVDAVGSFSDMEAMRIMREELADLLPRLEVTKESWQKQQQQQTQQNVAKAKASQSQTTATSTSTQRRRTRRNRRLERFVEADPILSLFEFDNDYQAVASASIGQVYKARIRPGSQLVSAIGAEQAEAWGNKVVAIKIQRPDVEASASLDMYLLRRTATWLGKMRGGDLVGIADAFGMQLYGELDYIREANNCDRFQELYGDWTDVVVPSACSALTRRRVLVMEWIDGEKGPWPGETGLDLVRTGLRCSVDQLMTTGLFHADPHRGNLLRTPDNKLAFIDFGMMADIDEEDRYGLFGLVIGLQNRDLPLVTENLLKLGFLKDTTTIDLLVPRLRSAIKKSTGGTGKASDVNFARLQAELDEITRDNKISFSTPPFFTIILRSLTILEGVALSVDRNFRLVRGSYPYVLNQLLSPEENTLTLPAALEKLLIGLLTVNGEANEIEWERLRDLLRLAQTASKTYNPSEQETDQDNERLSRKTIELFAKFLTSRTGLILKKPLVHELAEAIDGVASIGEANLVRLSGGLLGNFPGMNGHVNERRMDEIRMMMETLQDAIDEDGGNDDDVGRRMQALMDVVRDVANFVGNDQLRGQAGPVLNEMYSVIQMVAVEVLEIRGSRAMRSILRLEQESSSLLPAS